MNFDKIDVSYLLELYADLLALTIILSGAMFVGGLVLRIKNKNKGRAYALMIFGIIFLAFIISGVFTGHQGVKLMNGEDTADVQSVYHVDGDKITKVDINGHIVKFEDDNELKKGDRIRIKAKNVQIDEDKFIQRTLLHGESFEYEKID